MKIGIPSTEPNLDGMVENKLGIAAHLIVIETGSVLKAVTNYIDSRSLNTRIENKTPRSEKPISQNQWVAAIDMGFRQPQSFLPMLVGVILLLGLFQGFVSQQTPLSLFSGSALQDSFWGACIGSVLAGNPVNSYVIGKRLLSIREGLSGATALMLAWVNVGLIQLPVEAKALGILFALMRNIAGFLVACIVSLSCSDSQ